MAAEQDELGDRYARYLVSPRLIKMLEGRPNRRKGDRTESAPPPRARAIIELNVEHPEDLATVEQEARAILQQAGVEKENILENSSRYNIFAELTLEEVKAIERLVRDAPHKPIYKIWPDEQLKPLVYRSVRTIKADACFVAYGADGKDIVWAVADSGIDKTHPHLAQHNTTDLPNGLKHRDFTTKAGAEEKPLVDGFGHGTHVAGIIAGESRVASEDDLCEQGAVGAEGAKGLVPNPVYLQARRDAEERVRCKTEALRVSLRGVAPLAKLMSLKVLDDKGVGYASNLIAALEYLEQLNGHGRSIRVHGVNLSLGYEFDASWFAAGHSPLCVAVNRLSRSGVVVVVAAGNDGSVFLQPDGRRKARRVGLDQSINDPGNAEHAITVGATHPEAPHQYGVSYFSSRGPTADGRQKPDLVAPGERILSCAAKGSESLLKALDEAGQAEDSATTYYREESGTSMAAPHVSGAIAALLSIRREFIGRTEEVKAIIIGNCTDLKRKRDYQGAGLVDLMRALQSV